MNLAFDLPKGKKERENNPLQPYKIVSLLKVLEFCARDFVTMCTILAVMGRKVDVITAAEADGKIRLDKAVDEAVISFEDIRVHIQKLHETLVSIGLTTSADAATMLLKPAFPSQDQRSVMCERKFQVDHLFFTIQSELGNRKAMMVPADRAPFYKIEDTILGRDIISKFTELGKDATEAGNCFALGRYSAAVFHLMRVMERLVQRFGNKPAIKVRDLHRKSWGQILNEISPKINRMEESTAGKKAKKSSYHRCWASLDGICRGIRNPLTHQITHISGDYDAEEAKKIIELVKGFANDFAALR